MLFDRIKLLSSISRGNLYWTTLSLKIKREITRKEFQKCLEKCSKTKVTEEQMDRIMKDCDPNGDGKLNFDEFIDAMTI